MMTKEDYAARVPNRAEREHAAQMFEAWQAAELAAWGEPPAAYTADQEAALRPLEAEYQRKRDELYEWYRAEFDRIAPKAVGAKRAAANAAQDAYEQVPGDAITEADDETALRCALSGVPIYDTDVTMDIGGRTVLACVLLDPDQIADLTADDEEEDEVTDEAA